MANKSLCVGLEVPEGATLKELYGTNGKYWACSDGNLYCYSNARVNSKKPSPFRVQSSVGENGYLFVALILDGSRKSQVVHVAICTAFHGERPDPAFCVRHLDGNKINNVPLNLAWGSYAQNEADKRRHGTAAIGAKQGSAKLTDEAVRIIRASIPFGLWNTSDAAKVFGVDESRIRAIASGTGWKHVE